MSITENLDPSALRVEALSVFWGNRIRQIATITAVADVAGSLTDKSFVVYLPDGTSKKIGFNETVPATTEMDYDVTVGADDTATEVAVAIVAALDGEAWVNAVTNVAGVITLTLEEFDLATISANSASSESAGFTHAIATAGEELEDVGYTSGDIEVNIIGEGSLVDITAHQTGARVIGAVRTGGTSNITLSFAEVSREKMQERLLAAGGSSLTLSDASVAVGIGTVNDFDNIYSDSKMIVLHPRRLALSDKTEDVCFWKTYPELGNVTFSGESQFVLPATFRTFPDRNRTNTQNIGVYGDWSDSTFW